MIIRLDRKYLYGKKVSSAKSESIWHRKPWLITIIHTNGTITVQRGNKLERMNIRRLKPFIEDLDNE